MATQLLRFLYTGAVQTWTVPSGVTSVSVEAWGAGNSLEARGHVAGTLTVSAGQIYYLYVGGQGTEGSAGNAGIGGWNGGGNSGAPVAGTNNPVGGRGGHGASDLRGPNATGLANRLCVAGGNGGFSSVFGNSGSGNFATTGQGGNPGTTGATTATSSSPFFPGIGATVSAGGAGGNPSGTVFDGLPGASGQGGNGGACSGGTGSTTGRGPSGDGGGGGYYGGGGGAGANGSVFPSASASLVLYAGWGPGGGGSNYVGGLTTNTANDTQAGSYGGGPTFIQSGMITLSYTIPTVIPDTPSPVSPIGISGTLTPSLTASFTTSAGNAMTSHFGYAKNTGAVPAPGDYTLVSSTTVASSGGNASYAIPGLTSADAGKTIWWYAWAVDNVTAAIGNSSAPVSFLIDQYPNTPTALVPEDGSILITPTTAALSATVSDPDGNTVQAQFFVALASGGAPVQVNGSSVASGGSSVATATGLSAATAYTVFATAVDSTGLVQAVPTDTNGFTTNEPPNAPQLLSPTNNAFVAPAGFITFSWVFSDPSPADSQLSADFRFRIIGAPSWSEVDDIATSNPNWTIPGSTFVAGNNYEWQVRTYDQSNTASPWSGSFNFSAQALPGTPTITAPNPAASPPTVAVSPFLFAWTNASGVTQNWYQLQILDNLSNVVYDTGLIASTTASASIVPPMTPPTGTNYQVRVRVQQFSGLFSQWSTLVAYKTVIGPPPSPFLTLRPIGAGISKITIDSLEQLDGGSIVKRDFYRDDQSGAAPVQLGSSSALNPTFVDYTPASGIIYKYFTISTGATGGTSKDNLLTANEAAFTNDLTGWVSVSAISPIGVLNPQSAVSVSLRKGSFNWLSMVGTSGNQSFGIQTARKIPVNAGATYYCNLWILTAPNGISNSGTYIQFYDGADNLLLRSGALNPTLAATLPWLQIPTVVAIAPAGTVYAKVQLETKSGTFTTGVGVGLISFMEA